MARTAVVCKQQTVLEFGANGLADSPSVHPLVTHTLRSYGLVAAIYIIGQWHVTTRTVRCCRGRGRSLPSPNAYCYYYCCYYNHHHYNNVNVRCVCVCAECDARCDSQCQVFGPGRCDVECKPGFYLSADHQCTYHQCTYRT